MPEEAYKAKQVRHTRSRQKIRFILIERWSRTKLITVVSVFVVIIASVVTVLIVSGQETPVSPVVVSSDTPENYLDELSKTDKYLLDVAELVEKGDLETAKEWLGYVEISELTDCQMMDYYNILVKVEGDSADSPNSETAKTYEKLCYEAL